MMLWSRAAAITALLVLIVHEVALPGMAEKDPGYDLRVARFATTDRFPNQPAVILIDRKHHTYSFTESTFERTRAVKILTQEGIEQFGDYISDVFPKDEIEYRLETAVVSPDGKRTRLKSKNIYKVEIGKNRTQYRVAYPALVPGSIVEMHEEIVVEAGIPWGQWDFADRVTTLRSELVFRAPAGAKVHFNFTPDDAGVQPEPTVDDKYDRYRITMEVLPPYTDEPLMPPRYAGNPSVFYNIWQVTQAELARFHGETLTARDVTYLRTRRIPMEIQLPTRDWNAIGKWYHEYFDPVEWDSDENVQNHDAVLDSITENIDIDQDAEPEKILEEVLADFRRRFHPIDDYFARENPEKALLLGEGTAFELAYILTRILDEMEFPVSVVLAGDGRKGLVDERNPNLLALNHPLVLVQDEQRSYWIDPAAPECGVNQLPWESQGVKALWLEEEDRYTIITTPWDDGRKNCIARREDITIGDSGAATGIARIALTGQQKLILQRQAGGEGLTGDNRAVRDMLESLYPDGVRIEETTVAVNSKDSLVFNCRYSLPRFGDRAGDYLNLDFGGWWRVPFSSAFEAETRIHEIEFPYPCTGIATIRLHLPPGFSLEHPPKNADYDDTWFTHQRLCYREGEAVVFTRSIAIKKRQVAPADYSVARETINSIRESDRETIVLRLDSTRPKSIGGD